MRLILGSQSPRRAALLHQAGFAFEVKSPDCDENFPNNLAPEKVAAYISRKKAESFFDLKAGEVLLAADTVVVYGEEIFGKPATPEEAGHMLRKLSGKTHTVYTGITMRHLDQSITETDAAHVTFLEITEEEIHFYLENFPPLDKAGAYGIQDWLGLRKVQKISGSFYTVMGLPVHLLAPLLSRISQ